MLLRDTTENRQQPWPVRRHSGANHKPNWAEERGIQISRTGGWRRDALHPPVGAPWLCSLPASVTAQPTSPAAALGISNTAAHRNRS